MISLEVVEEEKEAEEANWADYWLAVWSELFQPVASVKVKLDALKCALKAKQGDNLTSQL